MSLAWSGIDPTRQRTVNRARGVARKKKSWKANMRRAVSRLAGQPVNRARALARKNKS